MRSGRVDYPNAPWFSELCDEYGFYRISESDMESHGCGEVYSEGDKDWVSQIAKAFGPAKAIRPGYSKM